MKIYNSTENKMTESDLMQEVFYSLWEVTASQSNFTQAEKILRRMQKDSSDYYVEFTPPAPGKPFIAAIDSDEFDRFLASDFKNIGAAIKRSEKMLATGIKFEVWQQPVKVHHGAI